MIATDMLAATATSLESTSAITSGGAKLENQQLNALRIISSQGSNADQLTEYSTLLIRDR